MQIVQIKSTNCWLIYSTLLDIFYRTCTSAIEPLKINFPDVSTIIQRVQYTEHMYIQPKSFKK